MSKITEMPLDEVPWLTPYERKELVKTGSVFLNDAKKHFRLRANNTVVVTDYSVK